MGILPGSHFLASSRSLLTAWFMVATFMGCAPTAPASEASETAGHPAATHFARFYEDAEQGSPLAQYLLGALYQLGEVVPQDFRKAVNWYGRAADQGLAVAQFALGAMYAHGQGVPKDVVRAHMWLSLSTDHAAQITGAQKLLRDAQQLREDVAQRMTPEQAVEAEQLARNWKLKRER
jgi:TPR repeat protein